METHNVKKVVIITEKLISEKVCEIIAKTKATGYTIMSVGGRGSRNVRSNSEAASVIGDFSNIKIEVIVKDEKEGHDLIEKVVDQFFEDFSGIAYMEDVEVLRISKFL